MNDLEVTISCAITNTLVEKKKKKQVVRTIEKTVNHSISRFLICNIVVEN